MAALAEGKDGILAVLRRMARWRAHVRWYIIILLFPVITSLVAVGVHVLFGGTAPQFPMLKQNQHLILLTFIFYLLPWQSSAFLEEVGFRGYAQEKSQKRWGPLVGTLILGAFFGAWLLRIIGAFKYNKKSVERWKGIAAESQKRRYPGDWVVTFVEGDGEEFDYGLDMTECGICKFYHAQGADELTPYMCLSDYVISQAFDRGLVRHKTLAEGANVCDYRYKKGRETFLYPLRNGWPPQFL